MKQLQMALIICALVLTFGCASQSMENAKQTLEKKVESMKQCDNYEQNMADIESLMNTAQQLNADGKISTDELTSINEKAGAYTNKIKTACTNYINKSIRYDDYQKEIEDAALDYRELKFLISSKK